MQYAELTNRQKLYVATALCAMTEVLRMPHEFGFIKGHLLYIINKLK